MADYTSTYELYPTAVTDTFVADISASPPSDFASATCFDVSYAPMALTWHRTMDGCPELWSYDGNRCTLDTDYWASDWYSATYTFGCYITVTPTTTSYVDAGTTTVYDGPAVTELGGSVTYTITVVDTIEITSTLTETPDPVTSTETSTRTVTSAVHGRSADEPSALDLSRVLRRDDSCYGNLFLYFTSKLPTIITKTNALILGDYSSEWCVGTNIFNSYCCDDEYPTNCAALQDPLDVFGWWATATYTYITDWQVGTVYETSTTHLPSTTFDYYYTTTETETQTSTETEYETVTAKTPTFTVTVYKTTTIVASQSETSTAETIVTQQTSLNPGGLSTSENSDTSSDTFDSSPTLVTSNEGASISSTTSASLTESSTESATAAATTSLAIPNRMIVNPTTLLMINLLITALVCFAT